MSRRFYVPRNEQSVQKFIAEVPYSNIERITVNMGEKTSLLCFHLRAPLVCSHYLLQLL